MDHSVRGYLERQSSEELMRILREFGQEGTIRWDVEVVLHVIKILKKRMDAGEQLKG